MPIQPEDYEDLHDMLAQQFAAGGNMQLAQSRQQMEPSEQELKQLLQAKMLESMKKQQENIGASEKALAEESAKPKQVDISPLFGLAKVAGGDDSGAKYYSKPEDNDEKVRLLRAEVAKNQGALTDDQINYLKAQLKNRTDDRISLGEQRLGVMNDRMDRNEHMKIVGALNNNKPLVDRAAQYQNLQNALTLVTKPKNLTPQQIHEFQQAVRKNIGISGSSGVGERESTYFDSLGLRGENWMQLLSGDPAEISKDSKLMQHLRELATTEMDNVQSQYADTLDAVSEGRASLYARRQDLKGDLDRKILSMGKRVGVGAGPGQTASTTLEHAPKVPGARQHVAADQFSKEDQEAITWAKLPQNKNDPDAKRILKIHGVQ